VLYFEEQLGKQAVEISGLVTNHVYDIMLGVDWSRAHEVNWNFANSTIDIGMIGGVTHMLVSRRGKDNLSCRRVIVMEDTVIPPWSQSNVSTGMVYNRLKTKRPVEDVAWATSAVEMKNGLLVARVLLPNKSEKISVRVMNPTNQPVHLCRGTEVTDLEEVQLLENCQRVMQKEKTEEDVAKIIEDLMEKVDKGVPEENREELKNVLRRYNKVFSKGERDFGWTHLVTHTIDTAGARPFRQPMRYPPIHLKAIDQHLSDMLEQGVIEPAASPWASNVVLAKKKEVLY